MARYQNVMSREYINAETGENTKIELAKTFSYKCTEDKFIMLFYEFIRGITGIKSFNAFKVLIELIYLADWNTGDVTLSPAKRKNICDKVKISRCNLSTLLTSLAKAGLISGKQSDYRINPQIFWKGELTKRQDILKTNEFYVQFGFRKPDTNAKEDISFSQSIQA